ncbi:hypothetical protein BCR42DRAFT_42801 [Absidia repens]|uniref:Uncharacterized protein n=1 Tax=Absidia repens TaxID=90262 RepID=A0A1X2IFW0_9FUNG|nr:hypothetical protein BCR42DRAFT_42801 [Absidia repens]
MPTATEMNSNLGSPTQHSTLTTKTSKPQLSSSSHQQRKHTHLQSGVIDPPSTTGRSISKKRHSYDSNDDLTPLNQTFSDILATLTRYDKFNIEELTPFHAILEKINTNHYSHPDEFKNDLDILFTKVRSASKTQQQNDIEHLYNSVLVSLQLEISRDHASLMMDTSTLSPNNQDRIRTALFRPTIDGFIFTDANASINQSQEHLPPKIQTIAIHPVPPESFTVPALKESIQQPYRFPSRHSKHEDKPIVPVQWLDYGAFTTFAPACDSNNANTSYESTYMGRAAKRHRRWERKQRRHLVQTETSRIQQKQHRDEESDMDCDIDVDWLKDQGLNVDAILESAASNDIEKEDTNDVDDANGLLGKNEKLIGKLLTHQENRFKSTSTAPSADNTHFGKVDVEEQETANKLQQNLYQILSQLSPSSVTHRQDIELAMSRLPLQEVSYRGSLPSNKIFAFPTSEKIDPSLPPPFANITPTYSKDRWRLIDVQGHDLPSQTQQPTLSSSSSPSSTSSPSLAAASPSTSHKLTPVHSSSPLRS